MKLRKSEIYVIVITLLFVFLTVGFHVGGRRTTPLSISTQKTESLVQTTAQPEASGSDVEESLLVDINTASREELMSLSGIGEALAQRIIDYRAANGPFASIADITNVSGIGAKKFEAIKDYITVS